MPLLEPPAALLVVQGHIQQFQPQIALVVVQESILQQLEPHLKQPALPVQMDIGALLRHKRNALLAPHVLMEHWLCVTVATILLWDQSRCVHLAPLDMRALLQHKNNVDLGNIQLLQPLHALNVHQAIIPHQPMPHPAIRAPLALLVLLRLVLQSRVCLETMPLLGLLCASAVQADPIVSIPLVIL
jgi:hypothetical protein